MAEPPRSNRPTPRSSAAIEAELRRRIRGELEQARTDGNGELDDASLAAIIARAVASGLNWHLEAPEHTRNATLSSRSWRPAPGPRSDRAPREVREEDTGFAERGDRPGFAERGERPGFADRGGRPPRRGPREFEQGDERDFQPRRGPQQRPFGPRGGGGFKSGGFKSGGRKSTGFKPGGFKRGGFGPRRSQGR